MSDSRVRRKNFLKVSAYLFPTAKNLVELALACRNERETSYGQIMLWLRILKRTVYFYADFFQVRIGWDALIISKHLTQDDFSSAQLQSADRHSQDVHSVRRNPKQGLVFGANTIIYYYIIS